VTDRQRIKDLITLERQLKEGVRGFTDALVRGSITNKYPGDYEAIAGELATNAPTPEQRSRIATQRTSERSDQRSKGGGAVVCQFIRKDACPVCGGADRNCGHLLAAFDLTFADEGSVGMGLLDGALSNISEVEQAFEAAIQKYTENRLNDAEHAIPGWCANSQGLRDYLEEFEEIEIDQEDYSEPEDHASDLCAEASGEPDSRRDALRHLLNEARVGFEERSWDYEAGPGMSSAREDWWSSQADAGAQRLAVYLGGLLSDAKQ
jgi:hypothetical protein